MSSLKPRPRWWFLITPRWLGWHAFAALAAWGMLWLGDWQLHRAVSGNALSWAYAFEWPIFTIFGLVFWVKTIIDEWQATGRAASQQDGMSAAGRGKDLILPAAAHTAARTDSFDDKTDPELAAYNAYLTRLSSGKQAGRFQGSELRASKQPGSTQPGSTQPTAG
jgi:hypothetical protein